MTSGTQGNQLAVMVRAGRGTEVLCDASAHIVGNESGGIAALSGAQTRTIEVPHGKLTPERVAPYIARRKSNCPGAALLALENTHNAGGGVYYTPDEMAALHALALTWLSALLRPPSILKDVAPPFYTRSITPEAPAAVVAAAKPLS